MSKFALYLIICVSLIFACEQKETINTKPNVLLIVADDQGWGDLSLHGNPNLNTPNIDNISKNGAQFTNFYVSAVCSPTRAEILTGRYAVRGGVFSTSAGGERLDLDESTLAEAFQQNGYRTAAFGKWHNGMQYPYHPNGRGFDEFYGFCSGHWGNYIDPILENNGQLVRGKGFMPDDLTNHAIGFLEEESDKPFFIYLPFNTPHSPMQVPDKWWNRFKDKEISDHRFADKENIEHTKAAYALCENIDWNIGRLTESLKKRGLLENTIVMYMSDNGPNGWRYNGDMKGIKGHVDEGGVKVPFFIQYPNGISPGEKFSQIASAMDIFPTLLDLTGIQFKDNKPFDGINLTPIIKNENYTGTNRKIFNHWKGKTSVRSQGYRLDDDNSLFDMDADPGQLIDVSDKFPEVKSELVAEKQNWEAKILTELPKEDLRTFPVGHPDYIYTQLPARDGIGHGNIKRSNRWPNCSYFTNWTAVTDSITWEIEVIENGTFAVELYYTCPKESVGSVFSLAFGDNNIQKTIEQSHNPPHLSSEKFRVPLAESSVKSFKPLDMGTMTLIKGKGLLTLSALDMKGDELMDVRLIMLKRLP